jgi:hypothetical protein
MKKLLLILTIAALVTGFAYAGTIHVIYPNGGETLYKGKPCTITWTSSGITLPLRIVIVKNGARVGDIVTNLPAGTTSYPWTVGNYIGGTVAIGNDYTVRVRVDTSVATTEIDDSNAFFTIAADVKPSLRLLSPNGGEKWPYKNMRVISWKAENWSGTVRLDLFQNGKIKGTIAKNLPSTPSFEWTVGKLLKGTAGPGSGYKVRVMKEYEGLKIPKLPLQDDSDNEFSIVEDHSKLGKDAATQTYEAIVKAFFDLKVLKIGVFCKNDSSFGEFVYFPHGTPQGTKDVYLIPDKTYCIYCYYLIDSPLKAQIREIDANYWGSGKFAFDVDLSIRPPYWCDAPCIAKTKKVNTFYTPKFTWAEVQTWTGGGKGWSASGTLVEWKPSKEDIGKSFIPACKIFPRNNDWQDTDYLNNTETDFPVIHVVAAKLKVKPGAVVPAAKESTQK